MVQSAKETELFDNVEALLDYYDHCIANGSAREFRSANKVLDMLMKTVKESLYSLADQEDRRGGEVVALTRTSVQM